MILNSARREGTVVVTVAVCLVGLLAVLALSLDGGMVLEKKRHVQSVADAASLAAASELFMKTYSDAMGLDSNGSAKAAARQIATEHGFTDGVNGVTVAVNIPPTSGRFSGSPFHAEVIITAPQPRYFARVAGPGTNVTVKARAVARGRTATASNGIIALNPSQKSSVVASGNAAVRVQNASIIVDSTNAAGMNTNGGGTISATGGFQLSGSPGYSGGGYTGTITSGVPQTPDPLRFLPPPAVPATVQNIKMPLNGSGNVTLDPGLYPNGIDITGKGNVTLNPGIYYMQSGGFSVSGQGNVTGNGVLIYNTASKISDDIAIAGSGAVTLSPMTTGPYAGLTLYQNRTQSAAVSITGNGTFNIAGGIYAAAANIKIDGNGDTNLGSQLIGDTFTLTGNGQLNVNWTANNSPKFRELCLVE